MQYRRNSLGMKPDKVTCKGAQVHAARLMGALQKGVGTRRR